jgi:hypothetical protein
MKTDLLLWAEALAAALALGCGGSGSHAFPDAAGSPSRTGSGDDGAPSIDNADATIDNGDAEVFAPTRTGDAGVIVTQSVCAPGTYQGKFMTYVGSGGDGGSPGLFSFMWNGDLTIDLSAQKITMTSMTGGEIPTTTSTSTLEIADGGALDGSDQIGGSFFANLSGTLDCSPDAGPPYRLTATLSNGSYSQGAFYTIPIIGHLTADYQEAGAATPPMLVNGGILVGGLLMDGGQPFASASGSWSATWVHAP